MMNYVITGGAGFIGSHLARSLLKMGHSVKIIDNLSTGTKSNLDGILDRVSFYDMDVLDYQSLDNVIRGVDGIFHLAALTSVPESYLRQGEYHGVNVMGTENIFRIAKKFHIKTVFASSSSVYGDTKNIPTPESEKRVPINPYGITKLDAENLAIQYSGHCDIVGLRYYNVYGQDMITGAGVITQFYQNIQGKKPPVIDGDGGQLRDFVHIDDVVRATILAMEKNIGSTFINIGSGTAISILDLANLFIKYSKLEARPISVDEREGNVRASHADISLAKRLLDWKPQTTLEDWIESLYKS